MYPRSASEGRLGWVFPVAMNETHGLEELPSLGIQRTSATRPGVLHPVQWGREVYESFLEIHFLPDCVANKVDNDKGNGARIRRGIPCSLVSRRFALDYQRLTGEGNMVLFCSFFIASF